MFVMGRAWTGRYRPLRGTGTGRRPNCQYPLHLKPSRFARGHFTDDEEAEAWIKLWFPEEYKYGVEMRCFDK